MNLNRLKYVVGGSVLALGAFAGSHLKARGQEATPALPVVAAAQVPLYPRAAHLTNMQEVIHVRATTDGSRVLAAHAEEERRPLSDAAEENAKTWHFVPHTPLTFTITYRYRVSEQCNPDNPTVTLRLPTEVEVCQYPFRVF